MKLSALRTLTFIFCLLPFAAGVSNSHGETILGLHGAIGVPHISDEVGARMVRGIITDFNLRTTEEENEFLRNMRDFQNREFETVVALRWPTDPDSKLDRIPDGKEAALDLVEKFILDTHGLVDWFQIQNEPLGGPGRYAPSERVEGLQWLGEVAARAREVIDNHGLDTKIVTPGITGLEIPLSGVNGGFVVDGIDAIIEMADDYADAIDIHLHVRDVDDMNERINYVQERMEALGVEADLTTLEWSQADLMDQHFIDNPDDLAFVEEAYLDPVTPAEWTKFMNRLGFDENFIPNAYAALNERDFVHAAYGGLWQFGTPKFDVKALIANDTVDAPLLERKNEPIFSWYTGLAESLNIPEPSSWNLAMVCLFALLRRRGRTN